MGRTSDARERLIESGRELIHERGYTAVGVSEICAAAGVKKGSFYYFFPSKVDLALGVIDQGSDDSSSLLAELVSGETPPLERLAAYLDALRRHQVEQQEACGQVLGCPIGNLALEMSTLEPELRDRLKQEFDLISKSLSRVLEQAIEAGDLEPLDAGRTADSIVALTEGTIMMAKMRNDLEALAGLRQEVFRLIGAVTPTAA